MRSLRVERAGKVLLPVRLRCELPDGVRLLEGNLDEQIATNEPRVEKTVVLAVDRVPDADVRFTADATQSAVGARAQAAYRFGRPEPRLQEPVRASQPTIVGNRNLGRAIELKPVSSSAP